MTATQSSSLCELNAGRQGSDAELKGRLFILAFADFFEGKAGLGQGSGALDDFLGFAGAAADNLGRAVNDELGRVDAVVVEGCGVLFLALRKLP